PHAYAYLPDLAAAFAGLMAIPERLRAYETVQFAGHWDPTGTQMRDAVRRAVAQDVPERAFPWWMMRLAAPFGGFPKETLEIEPAWKHPMRLDNQRLVDLLGVEPHTPLDQAHRRGADRYGLPCPIAEPCPPSPCLTLKDGDTR
ncbi:epimerase, partial [Sinorhizobium meliloti]